MSAEGELSGVWRRVMRGRDPREANRASSPLEAFFDLCFVVAVSQVADELHRGIAAGHAAQGILSYLTVFFAIWWAWMNFTWFASAYDTDDVPYRLLTMLQMGGVLVLASGVATAFEQHDFTVLVIGYVIMRVAMLSQWLRATAEHPQGRPAALRYAAGIAIVQVGWIGWLWLPQQWWYVTFVLLVIAELAVPAWAESGGRATRWHPEHIAERYSLFTIIVLGEVVLSTLSAVQSGISEHGLSPTLTLVAIGGLVLVFALWWIYFTGAEARMASLRATLVWGYGHVAVFAAIAAVGAGLGVAVDAASHNAQVSAQTAAFAVAIPVAVMLPVLMVLQRIGNTGAVGHPALIITGVVVLLGLGFTPSTLGLGGTVLAMGLVVAATLAVNLIVHNRRYGTAAYSG